jgi:hypothetical protein
LAGGQGVRLLYCKVAPPPLPPLIQQEALQLFMSVKLVHNLIFQTKQPGTWQADA